jgi:hypothetical protein
MSKHEQAHQLARHRRGSARQGSHGLGAVWRGKEA